MMQRHKVSGTTIEAVQERRNGSLRKLARELGYTDEFASTLSAMLAHKQGYVSLETENKLRVAMGLPAIGTAAVAVCPTCGNTHVVGDCHGKVGQPVLLAAGERVQKPGKPRKRKKYKIVRLPINPVERANRLRWLLAEAEAECES